MPEVSALLARVDTAHASDVRMSFDWDALHLYHCARRLYPNRRAVLRAGEQQLATDEVDVPIPAQLKRTLLSPVRLESGRTIPVEPSYPLEVAFAVGLALRHIVATTDNEATAGASREPKWASLLSPTAMAPMTPVREERLAAYRAGKYELGPWPHVLLLSKDPRRIEHMKRLLASLRIDRYEIVTPVSLEEAERWAGATSNITPTQKSFCASEHRMLSHPHEGPLLILEDDIAPFASIEDTRMLMRFLMQAPALALLEWCNADDGLCATRDLALALVQKETWHCTAAMYYANRGVRQRILDAYDAHRSRSSRHMFDVVFSQLLRAAGIPVTYSMPIFFQWDDEFTSSIDGSVRVPFKPFCKTTTRDNMRERYEKIFAIEPSARTALDYSLSKWPSAAIALVIALSVVLVVCAITAVIYVSSFRQSMLSTSS